MRARHHGPLHATARSLLVDSATAEVVGEFSAAGIPVLLLKGPAVARWLYDDGAPRPYVDSDLLIPTEEWVTAEALLPTLGYAPVMTQRDLPEPFHADLWRRERDGIELDLHRTLPGVGVSSSGAWEVLGADTETIVVAGTEVATLGLRARALHLALHAAYPRKTKALEDLERGLARIDRRQWAAARDLARRLDALPAFAAGLRQLPEGRELAELLRLPSNESVEVALKAVMAPPLAISLSRLAATDGLQAKLAFLGRKVLPTRRYMRTWSPLAARGPLGMGAAYVWRLICLLGRAAPAVYIWQRARTATPRGKRAG